jgi:hypothetical protein
MSLAELRTGRTAISLVDVTLTIEQSPLPGDVRTLLREAERRIERFQRDSLVPAFVPCDFVLAYAALRAVAAEAEMPGRLFCEWGSGFGVVTCLAAMLDMEAWGIEIECELVGEARRLARDFELPAEFVRGSFIPPGSDVRLSEEAFAWLSPEEDDLGAEMDLGPGDFNLVFAYPWPDEEEVIANIFDQHAMSGAMLLTYHSNDNVRLRRKADNRLATK